MRRFIFYILAALLTFGIGSFIALKFYRKGNEKSQNAEKPEIKQNNFPSKIEPVQSYSIKESEQMFPEINQKEKVLEKRFCNDKRILPVWKELTKDENFRERGSYGESGNCSDMLEIKSIDLNSDGQKEILLRGKNFNLCGGVGNCGFWIFHKTRGGYNKILSSSDYIDITAMGNQVRKSRTNGYLDILLKGHINAADTHYIYYKFDGLKYKDKKCLVNAYVPGTMNNPKWEFISCREYEKRQNY